MNTQSLPPRLPPIAELNQLPPEQFAGMLKPLFETAPPLAEALWQRRPFGSYEELLDRAAEIIAGLTPEQKVEVINAHPRIGEDAAAVRQRSLLSYKEQGYEAEAALDPAERERVYRELERLNRVYEASFGFKFVVFVNRRPKAEILKVLSERLQRPRDEEMAAALAAMLAIARDRLIRLKS